MKNLNYEIMIPRRQTAAFFQNNCQKKFPPLNISISKLGSEYFLWGGY